MRLTPNVLLDAASYMSPLQERVLVLRSLRVPFIENLDAVQGTYEAIDLTDNEITVLDNFPLFTRLTTLLLSRNRIYKVDASAADNMPNLRMLSLLENNISSFKSILPLRNCKKLEKLYLRGNPVCKLHHYRHFMIWLLPQVTILDFEKVKKSERTESLSLFGETFESQTPLAHELLLKEDSQLEFNKETEHMKSILRKLTEEDRIKLKQELISANTLDEIERIETALKTGYI